MANKICMNAKVGYKVAVCNALETLLVHADTAEKFLPTFCETLQDSDVEIRGCERTPAALHRRPNRRLKKIGAQNTFDYILSIRVVDNIDTAIDHIETYGSHPLRRDYHRKL